MKTQIAQQLLAASRNLDRIKLEIKQTVSLVYGIRLAADFEVIDDKESVFEGKNSKWVIGFRGPDCTAHCYAKDGSIIFRRDYLKDFHFPCAPKLILGAYNDLDEFAADFLKKFPKAELFAQSLVDFSTEFEKQQSV